MSTRDDDNDNGALPSARTGYRFPIRDRRFEHVEEIDDEQDLEGDDGDGADDDHGDHPIPDPDTHGSAPDVRVRSRQRPSMGGAEAPSEIAPQPSEPSLPPGVDPDEDLPPPEGAGEQVIDTPVVRSRVASAAQRARNVQLSDKAKTPRRDINQPHLETVLRRHQGSTMADTRSMDEFDRDFIEAVRQAFGEGFVPQGQLPADLGDRIRHIVSMSTLYAKDFILDQLERMLLARVPNDTIAARFRVSVNTIFLWKRDLRAKWRSKVVELKGNDIAAAIGENLSAFELRISMGMQLAQKQNATLQEITRGLEIAERAHINMIKYQDMLGLHDQKPLANSRDAANQEDQHVKSAKNVTNAIAELFNMASAFPVAGEGLGSDLGDEDEYQVG